MRKGIKNTKGLVYKNNKSYIIINTNYKHLAMDSEYSSITVLMEYIVDINTKS